LFSFRTHNKIPEIIEQIEAGLANDFKVIDDIALFNQEKALRSFIDNKVALRHFSQTTGYGYDDIGRDTLNSVYAGVFKSDSAIVSSHILSGTHAISLVLFGLLRPGNKLLSISGQPYDTLKDVISGKGLGSLADFDISYDEVPLCEGNFDKPAIKEKILAERPQMVLIQRSRGYSLRNPLSCVQIRDICSFIKGLDERIIIFVDNCYGEFTEKEEPIEAGADVVAGSLIKNAGGGIAPNGGYIAGRGDLIDLINRRLTTPATGGEIGSNFGGYQYFYQGLFLAPHVVAQSLKGALLMGEAMKWAGYKVLPEEPSQCYDIIRSIEFDTEEELITFCRTIQSVSPVDSYVVPYPWDMPGYKNKVIMAAGCFVQGSSIELSCDAPVRPPYVAYCQGGLTYEHVKIAVIHCLQNLKKL
jgi:cystathionine beta-lyase family protein involved in aluminum resistance